MLGKNSLCHRVKISLCAASAAAMTSYTVLDKYTPRHRNLRYTGDFIRTSRNGLPQRRILSLADNMQRARDTPVANVSPGTLARGILAAPCRHGQ